VRSAVSHVTEWEDGVFGMNILKPQQLSERMLAFWNVLLPRQTHFAITGTYPHWKQ